MSPDDWVYQERFGVVADPSQSPEKAPKMTPKGKVLSKYPNARLAGTQGVYTIEIPSDSPAGYRNFGYGRTANAAWASAARRL